MLLLLTSAGLSTPAIAESLEHHMKGKIAGANTLFFDTAKGLHPDEERVRQTIDFLEGLGMRITRGSMDSPIREHAFDAYDIVYISGGNTFYLLQKMKESGFAKALPTFFEKGGAYVGVSAGSIVMGPDIEIAGYGSQADENEIGLTDMRGLNLVPFAIYPHFRPDLQREIDTFAPTVTYPIETLTDEQAMLVADGHARLIG